MNNKCILITGGSGLVGTAIKEYIKQNSTKFNNDKFIFLSSKDGDLRNYDDTQKIFKKYLPTHVIHLAVKLMAGQEMKNYPVELLNDNIKINSNVLHCAYEFKVIKLISLLSSFAYPKDVPIPIYEKNLHSGQCHENYETYGFAKRYLELLTRSYRKQFKCNFICIIPSNIFGPSLTLRENGPVVEAFISKCLKSKRNKTEVICKGTGKTYRQFCYSYDLAKIIIWLLDNYNEDESINIAGTEIMIKDLIIHIAEIIGVKDKIKFDETFSDGPIYRTLSDEKISNLYKDYKYTNFDKALKETIQFAIKNITH
jgi:GDP-L-fucose synthase